MAGLARNHGRSHRTGRSEVSPAESARAAQRGRKEERAGEPVPGGWVTKVFCSQGGGCRSRGRAEGSCTSVVRDLRGGRLAESRVRRFRPRSAATLPPPLHFGSAARPAPLRQETSTTFLTSAPASRDLCRCLTRGQRCDRRSPSGTALRSCRGQQAPGSFRTHRLGSPHRSRREQRESRGVRRPRSSKAGGPAAGTGHIPSTPRGPSEWPFPTNSRLTAAVPARVFS